MWSAPQPQHPPFGPSRQGAQPAVGGRPSVRLPPPTHPSRLCLQLSLGLHFPAPRPPAPPRPGLGENRNKDLFKFPITGSFPSVPIQPSFPSHSDSQALCSFPPHYTPSGATGRAAGPLRGWPPPLHTRPAGCLASGRGPCSGAQLSRLPPSWPRQPQGPQACSEDVPKWGKLGPQKKLFETG